MKKLECVNSEFNTRLRFLDRSGKYEGVLQMISGELSSCGGVSSFCGNLPYSENEKGIWTKNDFRYRNYKADNIGACVHFETTKGSLGGVEIYGSDEKVVDEFSERIWRKLRSRDFAVWCVDR